MTKKSDFSKQDWQLLNDGPEWVFAALAAADGNVALTLKMKESGAFKKAVEDYRSRSALMADLLGDTSKAAKATKNATISEAVDAIEKINAILDSQVESAEAAEYRSFLVSIAEEVAGATGEGVLGLGEKYSDKEKAAMAKIKAALKPDVKAQKPVSKVERKAPKPVTKKPAATERSSSKFSEIRNQLDKAKAEAAKQKVIATHKVEGNQTLSHLALKYYGNATRPYWKLIHEFNKDVIGDDEKNIWAGLELEIPELPDDLKD